MAQSLHVDGLAGGAGCEFETRCHDVAEAFASAQCAGDALHPLTGG